MTLLDRYVLRATFFFFLLALALVSVLAAGNEIRERLGDVPAELLTARDVGLLTLFFLPGLVGYILPVTLLAGILMGLGGLAQRREILAARAGGVSLKRITVPIIGAGLALAAAAVAVQERVQPWAIGRAYDLLYAELPQRAAIDVLPAGVMHQYEGLRVYFERKEPSTRTLYNVSLVQPGEGGNLVLYRARTAQLRTEGGVHTLQLTEGGSIDLENPRALVSFDSIRIGVPSPSVIDESSSRNRLTKTIGGVLENEARFERRLGDAIAQRDAVNRAQEARTRFSGAVFPFVRTAELVVPILRAQDAVQRAQSSVRKERQEIAYRLSVPFAALAVTVVGAPIAARARSNTRAYTFAAGFAIAGLYYVMQTASEPRTLTPLWEVIARAWAPNLILIVIGVALMWRVDRV